MKLTSCLQTILINTVLLLLFLVPFVIDPRYPLGYDVPKNYVLYILTATAALSYMGILIIHIFHHTSLSCPPLSKLSKLVLVFFIVLIITSLLGTNWQQSFWGSYWRSQGLVTIGCYIIWFFLIREACCLGLTPNKISAAICLSAITVSLYTLYQAYHHFYLGDNSIPTYNGRLIGTFSNPNLLGGYCLLTLPFFFYWFTYTKKWLYKGVIILAILSLFLTIIFSFSKTALLTAIGLFGVVLFRHMKRVPVRYKLIISLFFIIIIGKTLIFSSTSLFFRPSPYESRISIWQNAVDAFEKRPLVGYGWENFEYAMKATVTVDDISISGRLIDRAHNEIIEVFVASGILGGGVYVLILLYATTNILNKYRQSQDRVQAWYGTLLLAFGVICIFTQFNFLLTAGYVYFWSILGASDVSTNT